MADEEAQEVPTEPGENDEETEGEQLEGNAEEQEPQEELPPPPPLPPPPKQKLFLLEFVVDDISLDFCNAKQLVCYGEGKTIVEFSFLDIGPLRITEEDFLPAEKHYLEGCRGNGSIKNGKSILFGLTPNQARNIRNRACIYCDIFKKTAKKEYHIGASFIRIINLFKELITMQRRGHRDYYFKNIKDCFKIRDTNSGELVGHIYVYIRVSCFKEMIVNKFKKDPNEQMNYSVEKGFYNYKYNKGPPLAEKPDTCPCSGKTEPECVCPMPLPADNCPAIYMDNACAYGCAQDLRPCQDCPPTCKANKMAGKVRERTKPPSKDFIKEKSMSVKVGKKKGGGKGGGKKGKK